jgi:hypothetical protein
MSSALTFFTAGRSSLSSSSDCARTRLEAGFDAVDFEAGALVFELAPVAERVALVEVDGALTPAGLDFFLGGMVVVWVQSSTDDSTGFKPAPRMKRGGNVILEKVSK